MRKPQDSPLRENPINYSMLIWFFQVFRVAAICAPHQSPAFKGCVTLMLRARGVVVNKRFIPFGKIDKYVYIQTRTCLLDQLSKYQPDGIV